MYKESVGYLVFKGICLSLFVGLMGMLYWSSTLVEDGVQAVQSDVAQLNKQVLSLHAEVGKLRQDFVQALQKGGLQGASQGALHQDASQKPLDQENQQTLSSEQTSFVANLLQDDPFYTHTLPKLLGADFVPQGIAHMADISKPNNLHPFSNWRQVATWHDMCNVTVAKSKFGIFETFAPYMGMKVEERINAATNQPEYWVSLRKDVFWQPLKAEFFPPGMTLAPTFFEKHLVTAADYKFFFDAMMNPYVQEPQAVALRSYYDSLEEFEIIDNFTFVVRWKTQLFKGKDGASVPRVKYIAKDLTGQLRPLPAFVYQYFSDGRKIVEGDEAKDAYRTNSVWAQNFAEHWAKNIIVSCGPWIFDGMNERQITFRRNPDFFSPHAALTAAIEVDFKASMENVWQDFKSNNLDTYALPPEQQLELSDFLQSERYLSQKAKGEGILRLDYVGRSYLYIGWNMAKELFKSRKVRRALTMAIDRQRIIAHNLSGMGIEITGPFFRFSPSYDTSIIPWAYDPEQARRLLEQEGWTDSDGDGVLDKLIDGKRVPFTFTLTYFVKSSAIKAICEYVATALKEIGIICILNGVDIADLSASFDDKSFDALLMAWALGAPPEDPRQLWSSAGAKEKGSSNAVGFANAEIDRIIDALEYEYDRDKRLALYHRFHAIIHEEQPYTFLYTPKIALLYREYIRNVFIPAERPDLIPGANVAEPDSSIFWIQRQS